MVFTAYMNAMWLYFHNLGLNDYATAGLMGNFYAESSCTSTALHDDRGQVTSTQFITNVNNGTWDKSDIIVGRYAFGLAQWRGSRLESLYDLWYNNKSDYANDFGNHQLDLDHVKYELQNGYRSVYNYLLTVNSYQQACTYVQDHYEVSTAATADRQRYTADIYNHYVQAGTYTITCVTDNPDGNYGSIYSSVLSANAGDTVTLSHSEPAGVTFNGYTSNDVTITGDSFVMPASNVTIIGHFTGSPTPTQGYDINIVTNKRGWVSAPNSADEGWIVDILIPPEAKRKLKKIESADVSLVEQEYGYSFTMPPHNVTITILFKVKKKLLVGRNPQLLYLERRY